MGKEGYMTMDSLDGSLQQKYGIAWYRCPLRRNKSEPARLQLGLTQKGRNGDMYG